MLKSKEGLSCHLNTYFDEMARRVECSAKCLWKAGKSEKVVNLVYASHGVVSESSQFFRINSTNKNLFSFFRFYRTETSYGSFKNACSVSTVNCLLNNMCSVTPNYPISLVAWEHAWLSFACNVEGSSLRMTNAVSNPSSLTDIDLKF